MRAEIKPLVIGAVIGYVLKTVWSALGIGAGFSIPQLKINVGGAWAIAFLVTAYGALKARTYLWYGLGMMIGIFAREQTSPVT